MSKKLIAVASAAALALSALVAMPSVATPGTGGVGPFDVAVAGSEATNQVLRDGTTSAKALRVAVPSGDVIRYVGEDINGDTTASTNGTAIKIDIQTPGTTDAITITATGGVEVLTATEFAATAPASTTATGKQSLTVAAANGDATVYAYTTSTAVGTVVVSAAGSSRTIFIQGRSTWAYTMNLTPAASPAINGKFTLTGTVKDIFGNDLTTELGATDFALTILGGSASAQANDPGTVTGSTYAYNATTAVYTITGNMRDTAGPQGVSLAVDGANKASLRVTGFAVPVTNQFWTLDAVDLSTQVAALTAQVAALKADYNALVTKWNKRVDSRKAPKKKAALK
jgi:hypothetical protein